MVVGFLSLVYVLVFLRCSRSKASSPGHASLYYTKATVVYEVKLSSETWKLEMMEGTACTNKIIMRTSGLPWLHKSLPLVVQLN